MVWPSNYPKSYLKQWNLNLAIFVNPHASTLCKVGLCRPKMTRDMIKKKKQGFSKNVNLCYKNARKCKIWHFLKITIFTFFIISLVIFCLQRPTLPQIKALEILFWPCFIIFSPRINICWVSMSRICIILSTFFLLTLYIYQIDQNQRINFKN